MTAAEIAAAYAGEDWAQASEARRAELIKEVQDSLTKGVPASWFAEQAIAAFAGGNLTPALSAVAEFSVAPAEATIPLVVASTPKRGRSRLS